jgi:TonB family protein
MGAIVLILTVLLWLGASLSSSAYPQKAPANQTQEPEPNKRRDKGPTIWVKGPCGKRPCCKPIRVTLPPELKPGVFSPHMAMKLWVDPDGSVQKVEITKSSGSDDVDRQLREGAKGWCMEKTKEGREVDFDFILDF